MAKIPSLSVVAAPSFPHQIQPKHGKVGQSYHLSQRYIIDVRSLIGQTLSSGSQGISRTFQLQHQLQLLANQAHLNSSQIANTQQQLKTMARDVNQEQLHLLQSLTHLIHKGLTLEQALNAAQHIGHAATAYGLSVFELLPLSDAAIHDLGIAPSDLKSFFNVLTTTDQKGHFNLAELIQHLPQLTPYTHELSGSGLERAATLASALQVVIKNTTHTEHAAGHVQDLLQKPHHGHNPLRFDKTDFREFEHIQTHALHQSSGSTDAYFQAMMQTDAEKIKQLRITTQELGDTFAVHVAPALTSTATQLNKLLTSVIHLTEKYKILGPSLGNITIGLTTFIGTLTAATAVQWLLNTAMLANPIGLVIAGVAATTALIVSNWDWIKQISEKIGQAWASFKPLEFLFGEDKNTSKSKQKMPSSQTQHHRHKDITQQMDRVKQSVSPTPRHSNLTQIHAPITVNTAPGMSEKDIAREVEAVLSQREQQAQAKQRGALFDYHEYAIS